MATLRSVAIMMVAVLMRTHAGVPHQIGRRPVESLHEGSDSSFEAVPIVGQSMGVDHLLFEPAPQLLNRIEPGGIGRLKQKADTGMSECS